MTSPDLLHDKLIGLEGTHWRGTFVSLLELETGVTDPQAGDYADVNVAGEDVQRHIWDATNSVWVAYEWRGCANPQLRKVKQLYESNPDTNDFTDDEKAKLTGIAVGSQPKTVLTVLMRIRCIPTLSEQVVGFECCITDEV